MSGTWVRALLLAFMVAPGVSPAGAAAPEADPPRTPLSEAQLREASAILDDTWSPFCPGRTLSSCTSGKAAEWREDVRRWLAEGADRATIMSRLQTRVPGFQLESVPDTGGTRLGPWVLGGAFVVALVGLALHQARRAKGAAPDARPAAAAGAEPDRRRLDAELQALED